MTEEANAKLEVNVFVNLFKNVYENGGKKIISYKPGFIKKDSDTVTTFPVGLGIEYETIQDGDYTKQEYQRKFWTSVAMNDAKKTEDDPDVYLTINEVDTKDYKKFGLYRTEKEGKISFKAKKPIEIANNSYRITLSKNTKKEKKHDLNLIFKETSSSGESFGSESEINFEPLDF